MIQNLKCANCGSKLKKINGNQWKCEHCDSIFENLNDKNPKKDLGVFVKYPSLSDAKILTDIEKRMDFDYQNDFEEKEMFLSELLNIPKRRVNTKYYLSLSREECVHGMANYDGDLICPNYFNHENFDPEDPPSITSRDYKFGNKFTSWDDNSNNMTMWDLRSMFWYHWHNWKVDDIPSDDILLEKAQEALEEEAYFTLYNISQCLKTLLSQENKYKAYIYSILATFRIQDLKQLSEVGADLIYKKFNDCLKLTNYDESELFDFLPPKSDIEHAIKLAPSNLKPELEKTAEDFDNIINEASYKIVERCLDLNNPFCITASKYIHLCRPDYKDVSDKHNLIGAGLIYKDGVKLYNDLRFYKGGTKEDCEEAIKIFETCGNYKDSSEYMVKCKELLLHKLDYENREKRILKKQHRKDLFLKIVKISIISILVAGVVIGITLACINKT